MAIPDREGIDPKKKEPRFNKILGGKQIGLIKRGMKRLFHASGRPDNERRARIRRRHCEGIA
jgi:hypothetical protein